MDQLNAGRKGLELLSVTGYVQFPRDSVTGWLGIGEQFSLLLVRRLLTVRNER
jgi:hypothetical protein